MTIPFAKMHGLGNDFVIVDARRDNFRPTPEQVKVIADRHRGVGCDQLVVLDHPQNNSAQVAMHIFNADGSKVAACGNATRCVAKLERESGAPNAFLIETDAGPLSVGVSSGHIIVDMGPARDGWKDIPLGSQVDTLTVDVGGDLGLPPAVCVNMGNPHAVFFVDDAEALDIAKLGPLIENNLLFPERTNVEFASVKDPSHLRMRVWERGAGITQACGTGACATLVAAVRRGLSERKADIALDGGSLVITWLENGHVLMEGPATHSFYGVLSPEFLGAAR
jgi:diaminopimelate epimerase